jgi:hypothetical protein
VHDRSFDRKLDKSSAKGTFSMASRHVADRGQHIGLIIVSLLAAFFTPSVLPSYSVAPTTATSITPASGNATGGTVLQITGTGFSVSNASQVADVFLETPSSNRYSMSFEVLSETSISASTPVMSVASQSAGLGAVYVSFIDNSVSSFSFALNPTVTTVSPTSGTAAGGNTITISGTAFFAGIDRILVGDDIIPSSSFTIVNSTTITASIPVRQTQSKTVGSKRIQIIYSNQVSSSENIRYSFFPARDALKDRTGSPIILGELASRTQRKTISRLTSPPYEVIGIDSLTNETYTYVTNYGYSAGAGAYAREGHQPGFHRYRSGSTYLTTSNPTLTTATVTTKASGTSYSGGGNTYTIPQDSLHLRSSGGCGFSQNTFDSGDGQGSVTTYCSVYGPEVYSEVFYGRAGQSLAFDWLAIGEQDDASVYGWLVAVQNETSIPYTDPTSHFMLVHSVQSYTQTSEWQTSTGAIPYDGLYRFRFTNGSYDGTGGFAIGSSFMISSVYEAGTTQEINFGPISDQVGAGNATFTVSATATNGGQVTITSKTTTVCTVTTSHTAGVTTVTITKKTTGTCQLLASKGAEGEYAPASDKLVAFEIRSSATKATAPIITQITPGNQQLTVEFTRPSRDGGLPIVNYQYSNGSTWVSVSPATTSLNLVITNKTDTGASLSNGVTYSVKVRALTDTTSASIAEGTASAAKNGTPNAPAVPVLAYSPDSVNKNQGSPTSILAPDNSGGSVTTYRLGSGSLPTGMTLNTSTGVISGNPSSQGTFNITIIGTNSSGDSNPATLSIVVAPPATNPPVLSWEIGAQGAYEVEVGNTLTTQAPSNSNTTDAAVFAVSPALPTGLSINSSTGVISGSPDEPISVTTFTITATNGAGSSTVTLSILVTLAAPNISPNSSLTFYVGSPVSQAAPSNTGGRLSGWTISPALANGLSFNSSTGLISGTPLSVSDAVNHTLSALNATGTSSITLTIRVLAATTSGTTPATTPAPGSYTGPNPTLFVPRVLVAETAYTVKVVGERLDQVTAISHLGTRLPFRIISASEIEVQIPAMSIGIKEIRFDYRAGGIVSYLNALEVRPPSEAQSATSSPTASPSVSTPIRKLVVWGFIPGLARLDPSGSINLSSIIKRLSAASEISCVGFTMGPTVLKRDIQLSYDRARLVCDAIKRAYPQVAVMRLEGRQDSRVGNRVRRVEVEWR